MMHIRSAIPVFKNVKQAISAGYEVVGSHPPYGVLVRYMTSAGWVYALARVRP